jgi:hypothetical protein
MWNRIKVCRTTKVRQMMLLKVKNLGEGIHPSEILVLVETRNGQEELAVDAEALRDATLPIGWPVGKAGDFF